VLNAGADAFGASVNIYGLGTGESMVYKVSRTELKTTAAMILAFLAIVLFSGTCHAKQISLLVLDSDTLIVSQAVETVELPKGIAVSYFTREMLEGSDNSRSSFLDSDVIVTDVMDSRLVEYLEKNVDIGKKRIYAVRGSRSNEELKKRGYIFDDEIREFYHHLSDKNVRNLVLRVAHLEFDRFILYEKLEILPVLGLYHPDASVPFSDADSYLAWYRKRPNFQATAPFVAVMGLSRLMGKDQISQVDYVLRRLEQAGFNTVMAFGWDPEVLKKLMKDSSGRSFANIILAFSLKFQSALDQSVATNLRDLNVPILNLLNLQFSTISNWQKDPAGIPPLEVGWAIANPELSGLIEPSVVSGKEKQVNEETRQTIYVHKTIEENLELIIPRVKKWVQLQRKPNDQKKVAILFYNHSPGKQNVGAAYLNVFGSLEQIMARMSKEGYVVGSRNDLTSETLKELILRSGRNIGNWAPGELDEMLRNESIVRVPVETYKTWFASLPEDFRKAVLEQWGEVEKSNVMIRDGEFIIPGIMLGNIMLMPEPSRGWSDDPEKLYHSPTLYPHHQYIAAYLWMKHAFGADAMIHLGTHATHEWLPGKQAGLSTSCPPDVLITDIPNIYPYLVDAVGEGIQAKRRGRGVIVDYLIPPVKEGGLYQEYSKLSDIISQYNVSVASGAQTSSGKLEEIVDMIRKLGIDKDLSLATIGEGEIEQAEHYLAEVRENFMPYGVHTFGVSPDGEGLSETVRFILKMHPDRDGQDVSKRLSQSGENELNRLIAGLNGRYVPPGQGNDPFRTPEAIPTGKNFYGFDPTKIPSKAAYKFGVKAAEDIIEKSLKEKNRYPEKVAMALWACETIRHEGINEATILHLMGMRPKWDDSDRVVGVEAIPGAILQRPRIDVMMNPSGLYRDLFPNMIVYLDQAVQTASALSDVENLIRKNSARIKNRLIESGIPENQAAELSQMRIFTETPGSYGNRVSELTSFSGLWEKDNEIAEVFQKHVGYAYGQGKWGLRAPVVLRENLKMSDVAVHTMTSTVIGMMDNDDWFQHLGGLSLAIRKERGEAPDTVLVVQQKPNELKVESISKIIGKELRTRYLNPKWIDGMKKENYAGAREMSKFVEYMWGWQVTTPFAVDEAKWRETYAVYVEDKYGLDMKSFFSQANPWAYQSITARMLESIRKDYWRADDTTKRKLAAEYAVNVVEQGVACCDHTCNNPLLNNMVVNIISVPGVLSFEIVERFKLAVERAMKKTLDQQTTDMVQTKKQVNEGFDKQTDPQKSKDQPKEADEGKSKTSVEGYKMEEVNTQDESTELPSSGAQWYAILFALVLLVFVAIGMRRRRG
jgi:cobaltochelatase CobN